MNDETPKPGMYWHVYHDHLMNWCWNYNERADYIRQYKLPEEHALRFRLFKPVRGQLPAEVVEKARDYADNQLSCIGAARVYNNMDQIRVAFSLPLCSDNSKIKQNYVRLLGECNEAELAYRKAIEMHREEIEALHVIECPDCPWDGKTISPEDAKILVDFTGREV